MSTAAFTKSGNKATVAPKLNKAVFGVEIKSHDLLKTAYVSYMANGRPNLAKTLKRGEVRGGGKKPWKQKGTGRARFGSIRTPLWRGGGIIFGPTGNENYSKKLNVSAKRTAIKQALSMTAQENRLMVIETFECKDGKVKQTRQLLDKMGANGKILIVVSVKDQLVERATRNLDNVKAVQALYLNVFDIINADHVIISQKSLDILNGWLAAKPQKGAKDE